MQMPLPSLRLPLIVLSLALMMAACPVQSGNDAVGSLRQTLKPLGGACAVAQARDAEGEPVFLWQHAFEDGTHDLAIARTRDGKLLEIHRVTYGGSREPGCHYAGLALARGGDWGWHLAWALADAPPGQPALRYARMDGAAWVSSPAKRFGDATAHAPQLSVNEEQVELVWQQKTAGGAQQENAVSADGGRSWQ